MFNIGIDLGTSRTKVTSDNGKFSFASIYARLLEKDRSVKEFAGEDALKKTIFGAKTFWPIVKGSVQGSETAVTFLIKEAIRRAKDNPNLNDFSDVNVAIGLPFHAAANDAGILKKVLKDIGVGGIEIHYQVTGTLEAVGRNTAIIVSIGHGTTEILVYVEGQLLEEKSQSLLEGGESILSILGRNKFLNLQYINENRNVLQPRVAEYASQLSNVLHRVRKEIRDEDTDIEIPIIITGGGIDIPGMKEALRDKMIEEFAVADEHLYSNAIGLHSLAKKSVSSEQLQSTTSSEQTVESQIQTN